MQPLVAMIAAITGTGMMDWQLWFPHQYWGSLLTAVLSGLIVGLERELRGKPAGMRTCILVTLGTSMFVRLGIIVAGEANDPTRVLAQVVSGIGFIGAGVIFTRRGSVEGVTTAATIWVLAAMGAMIGAGERAAPLVLSLLTVFILGVLDRVEVMIIRWRGDRRETIDGQRDIA